MMLKNNTLEKLTYSREEVVQVLGINLRGVDSLIHRPDHPIPTLKIGKRYLIPRDALIEWIAEEVRLNRGTL